MPDNMQLFTTIVLTSAGIFLIGMILEVAWFFTGDKWSDETMKALLKFRIVSMVQVIPVIAVAWHLC